MASHRPNSLWAECGGRHGGFPGGDDVLVGLGRAGRERGLRAYQAERTKIKRGSRVHTSLKMQGHAYANKKRFLEEKNITPALSLKSVDDIFIFSTKSSRVYL